MGYFSLGSRASRTPSPKKVNESMVTAMAIDGNTQRCQYERRNCWFSPTIWPHEGVGGLMPTPMNESAASVKMAVGIPKVIETTALGAAYAAGLAVGFWAGTDDLVRNWAVDKRWTPAMEASRRARLNAEWDKAVARSLDWAE